jgi:hypothetical protein
VGTTSTVRELTAWAVGTVALYWMAQASHLVRLAKDTTMGGLRLDDGCF